MRKGSKMSEKAKRKISKARKGQKPWNKGKIGVYSKATRRKMSEAKNGKKNPFYGKTHSEKTKRKMSKARKGRRNQGSLGVD